MICPADNGDRCLYVLFSRQNTRIGRFIRLFLRNSRYSHVAVALDEPLNNVYSFSRKRSESPFSGGFVREYPPHYMIGKLDVPVKLCRVPLGEEDFLRARRELEYCVANESAMLYNLFDALILPFGKRCFLKDAYTCVGFAAHLINMDDCRDIGDLERRLDGLVIYEGGLGALIEKNGLRCPKDDTFYERLGFFASAGDLFTLLKNLVNRARACRT